MKAKSLQTRKKPAVRKQTGKIHISPTATGLTSQAGLIPVVKYLQRIGFEKIVSQDIPHQRGDNADYQLTDAVMFTLVGIIGGATSMAKLCVVWSDSVLRKIAGWIKLPVETTIARLFKEITEKQINQFESVNHKLRGEFGAGPIVQAPPKLDLARFSGSILIPRLIQCAVPKRGLPKAITRERRTLLSSSIGLSGR